MFEIQSVLKGLHTKLMIVIFDLVVRLSASKNDEKIDTKDMIQLYLPYV